MTVTLDIPEICPPTPGKLEETGLNVKFVSALLSKSMYILGLETNVEIATHLKLGQSVVDDLLSKLKQQGFVEVLGSRGADALIGRFSLTTAGKSFAIESSKQCEYIGPAPVSLKQYQAQVKKQSLSNEKISIDEISATLAHLVLPSSVIRKLGPAVNSCRSLLIYGPPGNGKTSISEAIGRVFLQHIYVPHCIEVDGQVIRVFDRTVHSEIGNGEGSGKDNNILKKRPDPRWVLCRRPVVITGGELTLEMLNLEYDINAKFYEAPPQMKAVGGVFIVDDFGRQLVQPRDLLNRWIIPLEKRVDYLTIHTGKKFDIPFDELVIFSTNLAPQALMDSGLIRRIKYKLRLDPPSREDYVTIFRRVCRKKSIEMPVEVLSYLLDEFYPQTGASYAGYHPEFIVEHAIAACRYMGIEPHLNEELVRDALENLFIAEPEKQNAAASEKGLMQEWPLSQSENEATGSHFD